MHSRACVAGGCVWQGGMHGGRVHGRGGMCGRGVCGRGHTWQGACMAGGVHGGGLACMAGKTAIVADSTHPTGMHSCLELLSWHNFELLLKLLFGNRTTTLFLKSYRNVFEAGFETESFWSWFGVMFPQTVVCIYGNVCFSSVLIARFL